MSSRLVAGRTIHVLEHGTGTPVLFLHGHPNDHRRLAATLDPVLADRGGYRRIHVDLPGFGASPADPAIHGSDGMLNVVLEIVDELIGGERFAVVGESWGAYLARGVLARRSAQVTGVALFCPVVIADRSARDLPTHEILEDDASVGEDGPATLVDVFRSVAVVVGDPQWQHFATEVAPAVMGADPTAVAAVDAAYGFREDVDRIGGPFDGPSLIVVGRQDSIVGYRDAMSLVERFPRSTFAILDVAGHLLISERPDLVASLVGDWLGRVERAER